MDTNSRTEAGEEDTRCARKRGPRARAQATDLRTQHHDPVEDSGAVAEDQWNESQARAKAEEGESVCTKGPRFTNVQYIPYTDRQCFIGSIELAKVHSLHY